MSNTRLIITKDQASMLQNIDESSPTKKVLLKVTQEQYNRLLSESNIVNGGHARVDKTFKKTLAHVDVQNLEEDNFDIKKPNTDVPKLDKKVMNRVLNERVGDLRPHVLKLIQDMYTNPSQVGLDEYWKRNGTGWSELSDYLMRLGLVNQTDEGYTIARRVNERVFNTPSEAAQTIQDSIDVFLKKKNRMQSNVEMAENNYPAGTDDYDKSAPWNQPEFKSDTPANTDFQVVAMNREIAILKGSDGLYAFYYFDTDKKEFASYAEDIYDIDGTAIQNYVNTNAYALPKGVGVADFEGDKTLVKIDDDLRNELLGIYDKDPKIVSALSEMNETQDELSPRMQQIQKSVQNPFPQNNTTNNQDAIKSAIAKIRDKELGTRPKPVKPIDESLDKKALAEKMFNDLRNEAYVPTSDYDKKILLALQKYDFVDYDNDVDHDENGHAIGAVNYYWFNDKGVNYFESAEQLWDEFMAHMDYDAPNQQNYEIPYMRGREEAMDEMTSAGSASTGGSSGPFVGPMNAKPIKKQIPTIAETTVAGSAADGGSSGPYDANALPNITRDGTFKKGKKTKAQSSTQYPNGTFVSTDSCTKLNNNKSAQNGGCNGGAASNVVKQTKTSKSIISPSLDENIVKMVSKQTGKTLEEVTRILTENGLSK